MQSHCRSYLTVAFLFLLCYRNDKSTIRNGRPSPIIHFFKNKLPIFAENFQENEENYILSLFSPCLFMVFVFYLFVPSHSMGMFQCIWLRSA